MVRGDEHRIDEIRAFGELIQCDLSDLDGLKAACDGIDTVIHLAAEPRTFAAWEDLLPNNIVGTYHLFEAAHSQGCRRVIFASTVNAMNGSVPGQQIRSDDPVNPGNLYGVSKCFGEALCRFYASRHGLSGIAIRIGAFESLESIHRPNQRIPGTMFVSPKDLCQLLTKCVDDERLQFAIFQGLSNNRHNHFDISDARELLGYAPEDDSFAE